MGRIESMHVSGVKSDGLNYPSEEPMKRVSRLQRGFVDRLKHLQCLYELAQFEPNQWVYADTIYERVHPHLYKNRKKVARLFPSKMSSTLKKLDGTAKNDRRLVTSWIRKVLAKYNVGFKCDWQHRRNASGKVESVFRYTVVEGGFKK